MLSSDEYIDRVYEKIRIAEREKKQNKSKNRITFKPAFAFSMIMAVILITASSVGAYILITQETKPQEIKLSDLVPVENAYDRVVVNEDQARERAWDFINRLGLDASEITEAYLVSNNIISFWNITFDDFRYMLTINANTGAIYDLICSSDITNEAAEVRELEIQEGVEETKLEAEDRLLGAKLGDEAEVKKDGRTYIFKKHYYGVGLKKIIFIQHTTTEDAEKFAKDTFAKIPLEKNNYKLELKFENDIWFASFKTLIDGCTTRYKEVEIMFADDTKKIISIALNSEDIYDNNIVDIDENEANNIIDKIIENKTIDENIEKDDVHFEISYVDPIAEETFNWYYMMTDEERITDDDDYEKSIEFSKKINDGNANEDEVSSYIYEKWAEVYGEDKRTMFFGGNVFRKAWFVDLKIDAKVEEGIITEDPKTITLGIDATTGKIIYYRDHNIENIDWWWWLNDKPAKRSAGLSV